MAAHLDRNTGSVSASATRIAWSMSISSGSGLSSSETCSGSSANAADRTAAGADLTDLGVHRAGVDVARRRRGLRLFRQQELFRLGLKRSRHLAEQKK